MRYPRIDSRKAFDFRGRHYVGEYVSEPGKGWRHIDSRDGEALLMVAYSDSYEAVIHSDHPFLSLLKKRQAI